MEALYVALALAPLQAARQAKGALQVILDIALDDLGLLDLQELHWRSPRGRRIFARRAGDCRHRTREARLAATTQGARA